MALVCTFHQRCDKQSLGNGYGLYDRLRRPLCNPINASIAHYLELNDLERHGSERFGVKARGNVPVISAAVALTFSITSSSRRQPDVGPILARSAKFQKGLYVLLALISFFLTIARRAIISGSTGPIFAIFLPYESVF